MISEEYEYVNSRPTEILILEASILTEILLGRSIYGQTILDTVTSETRLLVHHELIFEYDGNFYRTIYKKGVTDGHESPWEWIENIECTQVRAVEKLVTVWEPVDE